MLQVACKRLETRGNIEFHALKRNDFSCISDNSVDKAYSFAVFCHLDKEDLFNYLREIYHIVAYKNVDEGTQVEHVENLVKHQVVFVYSQIFSKLFECAMNVTYNVTHPKVMMDLIDTLGATLVAILSRRFLIGLWSNNQGLRGEVVEKNQMNVLL